MKKDNLVELPSGVRLVVVLTLVEDSGTMLLLGCPMQDGKLAPVMFARANDVAVVLHQPINDKDVN